MGLSAPAAAIREGLSAAGRFAADARKGNRFLRNLGWQKKYPVLREKLSFERIRSCVIGGGRLPPEGAKNRTGFPPQANRPRMLFFFPIGSGRKDFSVRNRLLSFPCPSLWENSLRG